jgi:hypothetical protein
MWRPLPTGLFTILLCGSSVAALGSLGLSLAAYLLMVLSVVWLWRNVLKGTSNPMLTAP